MRSTTPLFRSPRPAPLAANNNLRALSLTFRRPSLPAPNHPLKELIDDYFRQTNLAKLPTPLPSRRRYAKSRLDQPQPKPLPDKSQTDRPSGRRGSAQRRDEELSKSVGLPAEKEASVVRWPPIPAERQLPPIHELTQDREEPHMEPQLLSSSTSFFARSNSVFSEYLNPEADSLPERIRTYENEIFVVFVMMEKGKAAGRVKEFKEAGKVVMERELKAQELGVRSIWRESRFGSCSFATGPSPPLKDHLSKIAVDELNPQQLRIKPRPLHRKLLANHCQELIAILRGLCQELLRVEGRALNNKLSPANLFLRRDGLLAIGEWGYSSFREAVTIRGQQFQSRLDGILRGEQDWFVSPEYLAPEAIRSLLGSDDDLWVHGSAADVWSLGLTIFEMMTLIPVWASQKCVITGKPGVVRSGVMGVGGRELARIQEKQARAGKTVRRCLQTQLGEEQSNPLLCSLVVRMLQVNPSQRISLQQLLTCLH